MSAGHVVFLDLDGTLVDSSAGILAGLRQAYATVGLPAPTEAMLRSWIGPPVLTTLGRELGHLGGDTVEAANRAFRAYFDDVGARESAPYEGIPAAMDSMAAVSMLVVVTHKPRPLAELALAQHGLRTLVRSVHAPSTPAEYVPKEDLFAKAIQASNPRTAVAVGDRGSDVESALANDIPSIGVTWGYGTPDELRSAGAVALATAPAELHALVGPGGPWA